MNHTWLVRLDQTLSSYSILASLLVAVLAVGLLYQSGFLGWALGWFGIITRAMIRRGFGVWKRWLAWADWWVYLLLTIMLLAVGVLVADTRPEITLACASVTLFMGVITCLAYMFIDIERYEVERGHKAVHNPAMGQDLAPNVARYGQQVAIPLLVAAAIGAIGGFALLNQGLYETVGQDWYSVDETNRPGFPEFLTYALIHLLSVIDVLDLADSRQLLHATFVRKAAWPAAVLLAAFRSFFTLILLQQVFASVRQGRLLAETIADFWSPHELIHDRACNALPQFGASAIGPLLVSLRDMRALTKEQRDQLPQILAAIGPSTIPTLVRHLGDSHEHVRAVAAAALGHLRAGDSASAIAELVGDPSDLVRISTVGALGLIAAAGLRTERSRRVRMPRPNRVWWAFFRGARPIDAKRDPTAIAVAALRLALGDKLAAVRCQAAAALGTARDAACDTADALTALLHDADETVRCRAAEALGLVGGTAESLASALGDPSAPVRAAAACGLKYLGLKAKKLVPNLVELLQDRDENVRAAAAEAVAAAGPLSDDSTNRLAEGLSSQDNVVRAQAAVALGTVDALAEHAAPPLVDALSDRNDVVRAKAVEALGKIGETAAKVAVPSLVRALRDKDSWVSALAAEALGEMGGTDEGVVRGLVQALSHVNPQVRANAAEAIGKLGPAAVEARAVLERAAGDEDSGVRAQAVRAMGGLGPPTPATIRLVRGAIADIDPLVRAGAAAAIGAWDHPPDEVIAELLPLLRDANDQVKVQVAEVVSKCTGVVGPIVDGLCQALSEDDSAWVQASAALGLAQLGHAASAAGPSLLRAIRTGEAGVREQAMRALVLIQPPEAHEGFEAGLTDPAAEVRVIASAGWIKSASVPAVAGPALVEALHDPVTQVRANAAYALARLETLPSTSVALLRECAGDPNDGLRLNAAAALRLAPPGEVADLMQHLLDDPNVRVRLVAAGGVLAVNPSDDRAIAIVVAAVEDPSPRVRQVAEALIPLLPVQPLATTMSAPPANEPPVVVP